MAITPREEEITMKVIIGDLPKDSIDPPIRLTIEEELEFLVEGRL